jgi:hypothetical protein
MFVRRIATATRLVPRSGPAMRVTLPAKAATPQQRDFEGSSGRCPATRLATAAATRVALTQGSPTLPPGNSTQSRFVVRSVPCRTGDNMTKAFLGSGGIAMALAFSLSACTNPYDPGQRAVGGGLIGAGAGAAIGAAAGGGTGAAIGAASGGVLGAITGAATTPPPPPPRY